MHSVLRDSLLVQILLLRIDVELIIPDDIFHGSLSQNGQHNAKLLPTLLFRPRAFSSQHVFHLGVIDWVHSVNGNKGTSLIVVTILSDVLVETSLVEFVLFAIALHIRLDHGLLHVLSIERRVS